MCSDSKLSVYSSLEVLFGLYIYLSLASFSHFWLLFIHLVPLNLLLRLFISILSHVHLPKLSSLSPFSLSRLSPHSTTHTLLLSKQLVSSFPDHPFLPSRVDESGMKVG